MRRALPIRSSPGWPNPILIGLLLNQVQPGGFDTVEPDMNAQERADLSVSFYGLVQIAAIPFEPREGRSNRAPQENWVQTRRTASVKQTLLAPFVQFIRDDEGDLRRLRCESIFTERRNDAQCESCLGALGSIST
jgi:hypothetical protein